jgi:hypothetical protein
MQERIGLKLALELRSLRINVQSNRGFTNRTSSIKEYSKRITCISDCENNLVTWKSKSSVGNPLINDVIDYFREKWNIEIVIYPMVLQDYKKYYYCKCQKFIGGKLKYVSRRETRCYSRYRSAQLDAVRQTIKFIKNERRINSKNKEKAKIAGAI